MDYKILKDYLNNNGMTISDLAKMLNVSRQTIYDWNEKGVIPKKYEKILNNIGVYRDEIKLELEIELEYGKQSILLNCDKSIIFDENGDLFVFDIDKYNDIDNYHSDKKMVKINKNLYSIKNIDGELDLKNIELNIVRYEPKIDFNNKKIIYLLYCSNCEKKRYLDNRFTKCLFLKLKKDLIFNIDEKNDFKSIVNYVKYNELDISFLVSKEEMSLIYREFGATRDRFDSKFEVMGLYLKYTDSSYEFLVSVLKDKFEKVINYYKGYYKYLNIIFICVENIKDNINNLKINYLAEMKKWSLTVRNDGLFIDFYDMFNIVFSHECGHLIFSYNRSTDRTFEERRANYFVSFIFNGKYDFFNLFLTTHQSYIYRDPLVSVEKRLIYDLENRYSMIDSIDEMYTEYYKEVLEMYEGK